MTTLSQSLPVPIPTSMGGTGVTTTAWAATSLALGGATIGSLALAVTGGASISGAVSITNATAANSQATGALVVTGGIGVGGGVWLGSTLVQNAAAGTQRYHYFQTASSNRWTIGATSTAEGGANSGSNFAIVSYDDASAALQNTLVITRSTGLVTIGAGLTVTGTLTLSGGTLLTTSANLTNAAAAQVATMTNGPTAGNPTKWIPINDNGTTRYIPAW